MRDTASYVLVRVSFTGVPCKLYVNHVVVCGVMRCSGICCRCLRIGFREVHVFVVRFGHGLQLCFGAGYRELRSGAGVVRFGCGVSLGFSAGFREP